METIFLMILCVKQCNCNCNYIIFTKLPWPGDSEGTFRSSSQAATCPPVYHTRRRLHTVPFNAERQAGKLWIPIFIVFGLTRPGIEPESTASVADALSTRPLIGFSCLAMIDWVCLIKLWLIEFAWLSWWLIDWACLAMIESLTCLAVTGIRCSVNESTETIT